MFVLLNADINRAAGWGMVQGVAEQIVQQQGKRPGITRQVAGGGSLQAQGDVAANCLRLMITDHLACQLHKIKWGVYGCLSKQGLKAAVLQQ